MTQVFNSTRVDDFVSGDGEPWRTLCRVATTTAGTLATSFEDGSIVDGITLATGDRILIKNQASSQENGIYIVQASGAPERAPDLLEGSSARGISVRIEQGEINGLSVYYPQFLNPGTVIGTTPFLARNDLVTESVTMASPSNGYFRLVNNNGNPSSDLVLRSNQTTSRTLDIPNNTFNDTVVVELFPQTIFNKSFVDVANFVVDFTDPTKRLGFDVNGSTSTTLTLATAQTTSRTLSIPNITANDTAVTEDFPQPLFNKSIDDASNYIVDTSDVTKRIGFDVTGSTATDLTLNSTQTTSQTLILPNIISTDTALVSLLAQTAYRKVVISGQEASAATFGTQISTPTASVECWDVGFSPDGLTAYVTQPSSNVIAVYDTTTNFLTTTWATQTNPTALAVTTDGAYICTTNTSSSSVTIYTSAGALVGHLAGVPSDTNSRITSTLEGTRVYVNTGGATDELKIIDPVIPSITSTLAIADPTNVVFTGLSVYVGTGSTLNQYFNPVSPFFLGGFALGDTILYLAADPKREIIYASSTGPDVIKVFDSNSSTIIQTIAIGNTPSYMSIANDARYLYTKQSTSANLYSVNLETYGVETLSTSVNEPSTSRSLVPSVDNSTLWIVGSGTNRITLYDVKRTQYTAYRVGQASQSGQIITGTNGTRWSKQMAGGVIVFDDGTTADLKTSGENFDSNNLESEIAQTVSAQNYTIYYRESVIGPTGSGILSKNSILVNPRIASEKDITRSILFDFTSSALGSQITLQTNQTSSTSAILNIPDVGSIGNISIYPGSPATTIFSNSFAAGDSASAGNDGALAIGGSSVANGISSIALGTGATTGTAQLSVAIGKGAQVVANGGSEAAIVIGESSYSTGRRGVVIGQNSRNESPNLFSGNIIVGHNSDVLAGTGNGNSILGTDCTINANVIRCVILGHSTTGTVSDSVYFRTGLSTLAGTTLVYDSATGRAGPIASSRRFKKNFQDVTNPERILDVVPQTYNYKQSVCGCGGDTQEIPDSTVTVNDDGIKTFDPVMEEYEEEYEENGETKTRTRRRRKMKTVPHVCKRETGAIAEDVFTVLPEIVNLDAEGDPASIQYDRLALYLIPVVKSQKEKIDSLETKLASQQAQIDQLLAAVAALQPAAE